MAVECSKSTKAADQARPWIQGLFLLEVGPLTELLDGINQSNEIAIDDMVSLLVSIPLAAMHCGELLCWKNASVALIRHLADILITDMLAKERANSLSQSDSFSRSVIQCDCLTSFKQYQLGRDHSL